MKELPSPYPPTTGEIILLHTPPKEAMIAITTRLALTGPVCVLDTGNHFDAYQVARLARRHTKELNKVLNRLQVARGFTCYQVVTLFEALPDAAVPHIVFDLLSTFYDENVSVNESNRLLQLVIGHLKRLRQNGPVVLSVYPPRQEERMRLIRATLDLADHVFTWETAPAAMPIRLL
jgi:hypothetical protein